HLQRKVRGECVLHAEGPVPDVGRGQIAVHGHDGTWAVETINGGAAVERALVPRRSIGAEKHGSVSCSDGAAGGIVRGINGRAGRDAARTKSVVEGNERLPVYGFISQSPAAAKYRLALTKYVPRKAHTRAEVGVIRVIEAGDRIRASLHLHHAHVRVKISEQIMLFLRNRAKFVTHAEVYRQGLARAPVVLNESRIRPVVQV